MAHVKLPCITKKECPLCHAIFETRRGDSIYCSNSCRNLACQDRKKGIGTVPPEPTINSIFKEPELFTELQAEQVQAEKLKAEQVQAEQVQAEKLKAEQVVIKSEKALTLEEIKEIDKYNEEKAKKAEKKLKHEAKMLEKQQPTFKACGYCKKEFDINIKPKFIIPSGTYNPRLLFCSEICKTKYSKKHYGY